MTLLTHLGHGVVPHGGHVAAALAAPMVTNTTLSEKGESQYRYELNKGKIEETRDGDG